VLIEMEEYIFSAAYKREEMRNPKNSSHKNVNVLQKNGRKSMMLENGKFLLL
jgi:hypothetical protein